jgi:hypothetical protein
VRRCRAPGEAQRLHLAEGRAAQGVGADDDEQHEHERAEHRLGQQRRAARAGRRPRDGGARHRQGGPQVGPHAPDVDPGGDGGPEDARELVRREDLRGGGAGQEHEQRGKLDEPAAAGDRVDPSGDERGEAEQDDDLGLRHRARTLRPPPAGCPAMTTDGQDQDREHDVVVFGATGFVGKLTAAYLAEHAPAGTRVALAGRSRERVERVRAELGPAAAAWPVLVAESQDRAALDAIARSATVVATTVGPYLEHGLPLVEACAAAGTHYADLTGETLFMRRAIDAADAAAKASGARIVHTCGFDSIPSDLGVLLLHEHARATGAGDLEETSLVVTSVRGGVSGGTIASLRGQLDEARASRRR